MAKQWKLALAIVVAVLLGGIVAVRLVWFPGREFDAAGWKADAETGSGVRLEMADRLLARRTLHGLTRAEVTDLLGEPPRTDYFTNWDLVYWLGPERGYLALDYEWLAVRLGPDGRVEKAQLVTD